MHNFRGAKVTPFVQTAKLFRSFFGALSAKNARTNSYVRAAVLDGNGVVVAHSSRYYIETLLVGEITALYLLEKFVYLRELAVQQSLVIAVACHTHKATQFDVRKRAPLAVGEQFAALLWREAEFGLLLCNVYLQQARYPAAGLCALPVHLAKQLVAVDAVYKVHEWGDVFHLVGLQVPDKVPVDVLRQPFVLGGHILCLALAEIPLPCGVCSLNGFGWVVF